MYGKNHRKITAIKNLLAFIEMWNRNLYLQAKPRNAQTRSWEEVRRKYQPRSP